MKPFAESCVENHAPILAVLRETFADRRLVLEIGSGTGQHACYFAPELPFLTWQTSDRAENHAGIHAWLSDSGVPNIRPPLVLDVRQKSWPIESADAVFSANTAHIMDWKAVAAMFAGVGRLLEPGGRFALYGPFNYGGSYTSESNARFHVWLKQRDPASGIPPLEENQTLPPRARPQLLHDYPMPPNNRTPVWRKRN